MLILSGFWDAIGSSIIEALRSLMLSLCEIIYKLIVFFFDIFIKLGSASILGDDTLQEIYGRIGLILGLFMIFRVIISLIQYIINPDLLLDKKKGLFNIVKKIVIVIVLLGLTRPIFNMAFDVQGLIMQSNIIPKIITGKDSDIDEFGTNLAWTSFNTFYKFDSRIEEMPDIVSTVNKCPYLSSGLIQKDFIENSTLRYAYNCVNQTATYSPNPLKPDEKETFFVIDFAGDGILAVIVGGIILWMIIMYVIQVGMRVFQLAYLQLIAPIPIIGYLTPKGEDTFNKWVKQCVTTYLDFFIRVAIIYFVIFIVSLLYNNDYNIFVESLGDVSNVDMAFINIVMILALLVFAQRIPKLFKELFPSSGSAASFDFGLSPKKVFNDTWAAGLIGGAVGAVGAGASNAVHGYMNMRKAWRNNGVTMKKWSELTEAERNGQDKKEYNRLRSQQMWNRLGKTAGAGFKGVGSVVGGAVGGARAGLKTKDITKSAEAIKTANKNRENRQLRTEAGYHWYNPLPAMEDKILEFSGDRSAEDAKKRQSAMRDAKRYQEQLNRGEQVFNMVNGDLADSAGNVKSGVFHHAEYMATLTAKNKSKKAVKEASAEVKTAEREVTAVYNNQNLTGEERKRAIEIAELKLKNAEGNLKAAEGKLKIDEEKHAKNQEIYSDDKEIESLFNYYADTHKGTKDPNAGVAELVAKHEQEDFEKSMQEQLQAEMDKIEKDEQQKALQEEISRREEEAFDSETDAVAMQKIYDGIHGVNGKSASEQGAPTEAFSAIAEKYKKEDEMRQAEINREVQERLEAQRRAEIGQGLREAESGVVEQIGYGPKITAENSIFVKLAQEAKEEEENRKQKEMQEEFKNRMINDSNNQNSN